MKSEKPFESMVLVGDLSDYHETVNLFKVNETEYEELWDNMVNEHHYLGFISMIGGRVKYLVLLGTVLVGAISFCSGAYKLGPRDLFIGWTEDTRLEYLPHLLNNNRFLILPWIKVSNLASHALALSLKQVRLDWEEQYGVEPYMVETFIDLEKYSGTCYVAANWTYLGTTKGFGRLGNSFVYHGRPKAIYVYIMNHRFKTIFMPNVNRIPNEKDELLNLITEVPIKFQRILRNNGIKNLDSRKFDSLLTDHIERYIPYLGRTEQKKHFVTILKGILSDLKNKTVATIAMELNMSSEIRNLSNFMTRSFFDNEGMRGEYEKDLAGVLGHPAGMITVDRCDFIKQGTKSVGVARQFCPCLGTVKNCQASVMVGYSSSLGSGLIDYSLYMPEQWFGEKYAELRERWSVPSDLEYLSKNHMMLMMIEKLINSVNFQFKYVGLDSSFSNDRELLDSLPGNIIYFAEISKIHPVFPLNQTRETLEDLDRSQKNSESLILQSTTAEDVIKFSSIPWEVVKLPVGEENIIIAVDKCIKVFECRDGKPGSLIWLYVSEFQNGSRKYALCNESMLASLETLRTPALMRWSMEQCFRECRTNLGMDHYEVKSWPGWKRHILFTFISHLFTIKLRTQFSIKGESPFHTASIE
jgi:SRSO17 transposase